MSERIVITISREYGSGGKEISQKLAAKLGISAYGDEIPSMAAEENGIQKSYFEKADEHPTDSFLYMLAMNTLAVKNSMNPYVSALSNDKLFNKQAEVIRELAEKEDCIIVGRCGGYILRDLPGCVKVFVTADQDFRARRIMQSDQVDEKEALKRMHTIDRRRASYVGYYAGTEWHDVNSYDLVVKSSVIGIEKSVDLICQYLALRYGDWQKDKK